MTGRLRSVMVRLLHALGQSTTVPARIRSIRRGARIVRRNPPGHVRRHRLTQAIRSLRQHPTSRIPAEGVVSAAEAVVAPVTPQAGAAVVAEAEERISKC